MSDQREETGMSQPPLVEARAFVARMEGAGIHPQAIAAFRRMLRRYEGGETGHLPWGAVQPPAPGDIVPAEELQDAPLRARGAALLGQLCLIRLNGGLGTTMKLERAKSLIQVREGRSFLDLSAEQVLALRREHGVSIPWLLMNSFRTRTDSLAALAGRADLALPGLPLDFLQSKVPRIRRATGEPARFTDDEQSWAPPGHGDLYLSLWTSGLLEELLRRGQRWCFVANVDNLGATVDPAILGYLDREGFEFALEVTDKSLADVKGGTLIRHRGRLTLLEGAQVEPDHQKDFQDLSVFTVFNTNNLWVRLDALLARLERGALELPMIVNHKQVQGSEVVQLESAMGAAVSCFDRAVGIRVPRRRFAPVKATCDLLGVRSDAYLLDEGGAIRPNPEREPGLGPPVITLDARHYRGIDDFEARFPFPLSLRRCRALTVEGDLRFGRGVRLEGEVILRNPSPEQRTIPDGAIFRTGLHEIA